MGREREWARQGAGEGGGGGRARGRGRGGAGSDRMSQLPIVVDHYHLHHITLPAHHTTSPPALPGGMPTPVHRLGRRLQEADSHSLRGPGHTWCGAGLVGGA